MMAAASLSMPPGMASCKNISVADPHVICCEMRAARNGTLLCLGGCGLLRPAPRRPLCRCLRSSRLLSLLPHDERDVCGRRRARARDRRRVRGRAFILRHLGCGAVTGVVGCAGVGGLVGSGPFVCRIVL